MTDYHRLPIARHSRSRGAHVYTRERTGYTALSNQEKQAQALASAREQHVRCPACGTATMPQDLLAHVRERCAGRPEPHPRERWVTWREAIELGMSEATLARAVAAGIVRSRGTPRRKGRRLLLRDLVLEAARPWLARRR